MAMPSTPNPSKSPRWTRISQLTPLEERELHSITSNTAGMSLYGNRARTSVMLPLDLARLIAKEASQRNCTVNQVIVDMLDALHVDSPLSQALTNNPNKESEH